METLQPIRFEEAQPLLITGLSAHYTMETRGGIATQWERFWEQVGNTSIPHATVDFYGVSYEMEDTGAFQYLCGVPLADGFTPMEDWSTVEILNAQYAVFCDWGDLSRIHDTYNYVFGEWLPGSSYSLAAAPSFELYGQQFDPATGMGAELWVPVKGK